jgi:hypothetical protein
VVSDQNMVVEDKQIADYRNVLSKFSAKVLNELKTNGPKIAGELLIDGLKSLPVIPPSLTKYLSSFIQRKLGAQMKDESSIEYAVEFLKDMQESNEAFKQTLEVKLGYSFSELQSDLKSVSAAIEEQNRLLRQKDRPPQLEIMNPTLELNYPIEDNKLKMLLANIGNGTVVAKEIYLDVEKYEPVVDVDFSMPAAPPLMLFLKAQLSVDKTVYPLLKENGEPERFYYAEGAGAEKVVINISSKNNAKYWVRVRIPYFDIATNQGKAIYYPALDKEAFVLSYKYAPAWTSNVQPKDLLKRSEVYENIANKFKQILIAFQDSLDLNLNDEREIYKKVNEILGTEYVMPDYFLNKFISDFASIATLEKRQDMIPTILRLIMYYEGLLGGKQRPLNIYVEELALLCGNMDLKPVLERFVGESFSEKQQTFKEILPKIKPLN